MDEAIEKEIKKAVEILKQFGATEVYLFGSWAKGKARPESDLDLAEKGVPANKFFSAYGHLIMAMDREVHLIALDRPTDFSEFLKSRGELRYVE